MKQVFIMVTVLFCLIAWNTVLAQTMDWNVTLSNPDQSGMPGDVLIFSGTISNYTGSDLVLNNANLAFSTVSTSFDWEADFTDEFLNTNLVIPDSGYTGSLFFVHWLPTAMSGLVGTGTVDLSVDAPTFPSAISVPFRAMVSGNPTPEPGVLPFLGTGLITALWMPRRKHWQCVLMHASRE